MNTSAEELDSRLRSHPYVPNPAVHSYLQRQLSSPVSDELIAVLRRQDSGVSGEGSVDECDATHQRCITPLLEPHSDHDCHICQFPAINPFRCTRKVSQPSDSSACTDVYHICCYQCLSNYMSVHRTDSFDCPYCRINEFRLSALVCVSEERVRESESLFIFCPNNCGLGGSPIALANHICPLQSSTSIPHTSVAGRLYDLEHQNNDLSARVRELEVEKGRLTLEIRETLENYNKRKEYSLEWQSKYEEVSGQLTIAVEKWLQLSGQLSQKEVMLEMIENMNRRLRYVSDQKDQMIDNLRAKKAEAIKRCKTNMKKVAKHFKTKEQELNERIGRLMAELDLLINNTVMAEHRATLAAAASEHPTSHWSQVDSNSSDEQSLGFRQMFADIPVPSVEDKAPDDMPESQSESASDEEQVVDID